MVLIPEETVQMVKEQVNIVDIIDQFVALKKRGKNHFGYCPFHDERTPSFSVSEDKQIYKCFSCGRAGNVFSFFMEKDGLSFPEAVQYVAELGHIPVNISVQQIDEKEKSPQQVKVEQLVAMHQLAVEFYHQILLHTLEGEKARQYLKERGFTQETIETFKIGVAPSGSDLLVTLLQNKGYSEDLIRQSGLAASYEGRLLDRFKDRVMFPLRNEKGQFVAFSGRIYLEVDPNDTSEYKDAKYLNSPETIIFNKGSFIFNLDLARPTIRQLSEFVLCEGFMDVLATWQAGVRHSVASMGTSLTEEQIHKLKRLASRVLIAFDGDSAGQSATDRAIRLLRKVGDIQINVLPMLDNMDPDEMIQTRGATYFLEYIKHNQETDFAFYRRYYAQQMVLDTQRSKLDYIDILLQELLNVSSVTERSMYLKELSDEFHVSLSALEDQLRLFSNRQKKMAELPDTMDRITKLSIVAPNKVSLRERAEDQLLKRILTNDQALYLLSSEQKDFSFSNERDQLIYLLFQSFKNVYGSEGTVSMFSATLNNITLINRVSYLLSTEFDDVMTDEEILDLLNSVNRDTIKKQISLKRKELIQAEMEKNEEQIHQLLLELDRLTKKLK